MFQSRHDTITKFKMIRINCEVMKYSRIILLVLGELFCNLTISSNHFGLDVVATPKRRSFLAVIS